MQLMEGGSLYDALYVKKSSLRKFLLLRRTKQKILRFSSSKFFNYSFVIFLFGNFVNLFSFLECSQIALQIAEGLAFLHTRKPPIAHR